MSQLVFVSESRKIEGKTVGMWATGLQIKTSKHC